MNTKFGQPEYQGFGLAFCTGRPAWPNGIPAAPKRDEVNQAKPFIGRGVNPITQYPKKKH